MIKIFNQPGEWESKVNFVDDKNRLVGYDTEDDCCAHGGWFIATEIKDITNDENAYLKKEPDVKPVLDDYVFDEQFFKDLRSPEGEGGTVVFRMVAPSKPDLYLHLFNVHNGYYAKGFEASFGKKREGCV